MAEKDTKKSTLPIVEAKPIEEKLSPSAPTDDKFVHGIFIHRVDGQKYALCIHEPDGYDNTHSLKNTANFWQGTKEAFKNTFDKA